MGKLPKAYIVRCNSTNESTEVCTFIKGRLFQTYSRYVIKHDGLLDKIHSDANIWDEIPEKVTHLPILTYKTWVKMKDFKEFVLPKKWFIKCTASNRTILNKWRKERANKVWCNDAKHLRVGSILLSKNISDDSYYYDNDRFYGDDYSDYIEITITQFKHYVLKLTKTTTEIKKETMKVIRSNQAQEIIDIACSDWKPKLAKLWGENIVLSKNISITEMFYQDMRKACTKVQHELFDLIFGKEITVKKGDWVITTVNTDKNFEYNKKGMIFKVIDILKTSDDVKVFYKTNEAISIEKVKVLSNIELKNHIKRKMIDLASEYDLIPTSITL